MTGNSHRFEKFLKIIDHIFIAITLWISIYCPSNAKVHSVGRLINTLLLGVVGTVILKEYMMIYVNILMKGKAKWKTKLYTKFNY